MTTQFLQHAIPTLKDANLEKGFFNIINGESVSSVNNLAITSPVTGKTLASVTDIDRTGLHNAVAAAQAAFAAWSSTPSEARRDAASKLLAKIHKRTHELSAILTAEQGRPFTSSNWEIVGLAQFFGPGFLKLRLEDARSENAVGRDVSGISGRHLETERGRQVGHHKFLAQYVSRRIDAFAWAA